MLRFLDLPAAQRAAMGQSARAHMERAYDEERVVTAYRAALAEIGLPPGRAA